MRILVVGAGEVGFHLARRLSEEGQDVVVIEADPERAERVGEELDVIAIEGNGASLPVLDQAGIENTDLVLAVTSKDEVNLIACLAAHELDVRFRVARISNPEYYEGRGILSREQFGVDLMINPEQECAWEAFQLLSAEAATDLAKFFDGRLQMVGLRVQEGALVAGRTLAELDRELRGRRYTTVAIVRDGVTEIPRGASRIEAGDHLYLLSPAEEMSRIPPLAGYEGYRLRRVMIAGGSREAVYLARYLHEHDVTCTLLDRDRERCQELAEELPGTLVLHGDATDLELLVMEGVEGVDGFVSFTGQDETNMLSSLLAKHSGARKVVSLIDRVQYVPLVSKVGVDAVVSPRMSTVNAILRYVRRGNVRSVATLKGIDAEAMELVVGPEAPVLGRPFREVDFPRRGVVGAILRDGEVLTPRGEDAVREGDRVIVVTLPEAITDFEDLFA